jgi:group I intron endonuclease
MKITIYKVTNLINNKLYIGITKQSLNKRLNQHFSNNYPLGKAMKKYGKVNFSIDVLEFANTLEDALKKETHYIKEFNTMIENDKGYNLISDTTCGEFTDIMKLNLVNSLKLKKQKVGKYIGVYQLKSNSLWGFSFSLMGKTKRCNNFNSAYDAAIGRDITLVNIFKKEDCFFILNFPELYHKYKTNIIKYPERILKRKLKKSKFKFINYEKKLNNWRVKIKQPNGNRITIGTYSNEIDAAMVADFYNLKYYDDVSILNFPENLNIYKNNSFELPKTIIQSIKKCSHKNIGYEIRKGKIIGYRVYIETKFKKYRSYHKTLKNAIDERDTILKMINRKIPD